MEVGSAPRRRSAAKGPNAPTGTPATLAGLDLDDSTAAEDLAFLRAPTWPADGNTGPELTVVDLFCGCGGMTLGVWEAARRAGRNARAVLACDISESQLAVYAANFGTKSVKNEDLNRISSLIGSAPTPLEIRLLRPLRDQRIDFLVAGPPCQGHSNLNNHTRRSDPKNELYPKVARAAELIAPTHILIENVPGVMNDHGEAVNRTIEALHSLDYVTTSGVVSLAKLGVAQTRKRHLLVATKATRDASLIDFAKLTSGFTTAPRSLRWAIDDLQATEGSGIVNETPGMTDRTKERVDWLFDNDMYNLPDTERPDCHRTKPHTYQSVYGRMDWESPAPTITSGFMTMGRGRFVHPLERRTLTPREAARVQFFPDFYDFSPLTTRKSIGEAIGNAVPPKMSMVFAAALLRLTA